MKIITFIAILLFMAAGPAHSQWKKIYLRSAMGLYLASSELDGGNPYELGEYGAHNLFDKDGSTAWVEGVKGDGIGESVYVGINEIPEDEIIIEVYEEIDERMIYVNTNKRKNIILVDGKALEKAENLVEGQYMDATLMDMSPDKEWAQIDYLYNAEGARVEEYAQLYSVRYLARINEKILKTIYGMYGFIEKDGKTYLDTADGLIDLEDIMKRFMELRKEEL